MKAEDIIALVCVILFISGLRYVLRKPTSKKGASRTRIDNTETFEQSLRSRKK